MDFSAVAGGILRGLLIILGGSVILGLFLGVATLIEPQTYFWLLAIIFIVAIFYSGLVAGKYAQKSGWLHGGIAGLLLTVIIEVLGLIFFEVSAGLPFIWYILGFFIIGAFAGGIGVNLSR